MRLKDYYRILEVSAGASQQEIKKAFRHLAKKYHPDKNAGNQCFESHFKEVQEAYHILSDPVRRSSYNQQRWYRHGSTKLSTDEPVTPALILDKARKLGHYVATLDTARVDKQALHQYIFHLLSKNNINILLECNDHYSNSHIVIELLKASRSLSFSQMQKISERLKSLAGTDNILTQTINDSVQDRKLSGYWQQYQVLIIFMITLVLCWLIYIVSS